MLKVFPQQYTIAELEMWIMDIGFVKVDDRNWTEAKSKIYYSLIVKILIKCMRKMRMEERHLAGCWLVYADLSSQ